MSSHNDHLGSLTLTRPDKEQQWLTNISYSDWVTGTSNSDLSEPSFRSDGFDFEQVLNYDHLNWLLKNYGAWLIYLDSKITGDYGEMVVQNDNSTDFKIGLSGGVTGTSNNLIFNADIGDFSDSMETTDISFSGSCSGGSYNGSSITINGQGEFNSVYTDKIKTKSAKGRLEVTDDNDDPTNLEARGAPLAHGQVFYLSGALNLTGDGIGQVNDVGTGEYELSYNGPSIPTLEDVSVTCTIHRDNSNLSSGPLHVIWDKKASTTSDFYIITIDSSGGKVDLPSSEDDAGFSFILSNQI
jgi:hypothetical protein